MGHVVQHGGIAVVFRVGGFGIIHIGCVRIDDHPAGLITIHVGAEADDHVALVDEQEDNLFRTRIVEYFHISVCGCMASIYIYVQLVDFTVLTSYQFLVGSLQAFGLRLQLQRTESEGLTAVHGRVDRFPKICAINQK